MQQNKSPFTRYHGVQALRGFAALMVVLFHAVRMVREKLGGPDIEFLPGASGVDIFFAISGFVIVLTTAPHWGTQGVAADFLWRRILRIVPLYWFMTLCMLLLLLFLPHLASYSEISPWHSLASFLFIPAWNASHEAFPLIIVGWTLAFEMLFYVLFAAALALNLKPVGWLSGLLAILAFAGLFRTDAWGAPATLLDPMLLEFIFGMWIGVATLNGRGLPEKAALWLAPLMIILLCASNLLPAKQCFEWRVLLWGIPGALLLASVVALEKRWREHLANLPRLLGDASYSIYLSHGLVVSFIGITFARLDLGYPMTMAFGFVGTVLLSAVGGIAIYRFIERPITAWAQNFPARRAPLRIA